MADQAARRRALTDTGASLLVEAGAGTGKTSLLAGRVALMLAQGVDPAAIAAITFTELAAADLSTRIAETIADLLAGTVPPALSDALPEGLSALGVANLEAASGRLDALTTCTIHGFCQEMIRSYAVEADIDPGAQVVDRENADLAFDLVFDAWLKHQLSRIDADDSDPVAVMARDDPRRMEQRLRELARFQRRHRSARVPSARPNARPDIDLAEAARAYRSWCNDVPCDDWQESHLADLERIASFYHGAFDKPLDFAGIWHLAHPPRISGMAKDSYRLTVPQRVTYWKRAVGVDAGPAHEAAARAHFEAVANALGATLGMLATALVETLSGTLAEVERAYADHKRQAALLDFDDLLEHAGRMLRAHAPVRRALSARFRHLLVDEFQDTDPLQCEIIFALASEGDAEDWTKQVPRAGALFLVGDPKQAIYRFRGAHVETYEQARRTFLAAWPDNLLRVTANFRSRCGILTHVNRAFVGPLSAPGQPGHVDLDPTREDLPGLPSALRLPVEGAPTAARPETQDAEAEAVAGFCANAIGRLEIGGPDAPRLLQAGDIALLAPTGNDLWRYERELRRAGLPFSSQAGKGLLRRQEAQDILTLARVLANARDTLAFGALLRGPLIGFTDEQILDFTAALPPQPNGAAVLGVQTPLEQIADPALREVTATLQSLRLHIRSTSPVQLLDQAIERMNVRAILARRDPPNAAAMDANIDALLRRAERYGVRGLTSFVSDLDADWRNAVKDMEGRPDTDGTAIDIVTIHSAKGLEWPLVIPINACVRFRPREEFVHSVGDDTLHWMIGDVAPPHLAMAIQADTDAAMRERVRLWYVACTRARDLLVLPRLPGIPANSWASAVDLLIDGLPVLPAAALATAPGPSATPADPVNTQDPARFAAEAMSIAAMAAPIRWVRPSAGDTDRMPMPDILIVDDDDGDDPDSERYPLEPVGGGRVRGLLLHKLLEEVIEEGLEETVGALAARAAALAVQIPLIRDETSNDLDLQEIAASALRTLNLAEVAELRPRLRAEIPVYGILADDSAVAGRADAVALGIDGAIEIVIDWKSDVAPDALAFAQHAAQVRIYLESIGAARGLIVYVTLGWCRWIDP